MKKIVLLKIEVPIGSYCYGGEDKELCEYFSNSGGHESCNLDLGTQKRSKEGWVLKPNECKYLDEV